MTYPMARTAGERVQNQWLRENEVIEDHAIGKSGEPNSPIEIGHIRLALGILKDPVVLMNIQQGLGRISIESVAEVNGLTAERVAIVLGRLATPATVDNLTPGEARLALDQLKAQDSISQSSAPGSQNWFLWAVGMVVTAETYEIGSAAHLLHNAARWTPTYRQTIITNLEARVAVEEKKQ